ncbi:MAG: hypothetical protein HY567_04650 [Candidatus Kerfeldbacteria bacterium]|nr:hypothetical protein [Candidatus Kerfeldbacteria bacterium]
MSFPICGICGVELGPDVSCPHVEAFFGPRPKLTRREQLGASRMTGADWARMFPAGVALHWKRTTTGMTCVDLDSVLP